MSDAPSYSYILEELERELAGKSDASFNQSVIMKLANLEYEITLLKKKQAAYSISLRSSSLGVSLAEANRRPVNYLDIAMDDAIDPLSGFYPLEYDETGPYRWTGPSQRVNLYVWLDRTSAVELNISVMSFGDLRNRDELSIEIDGKRVSVTSNEQGFLSEPFFARTSGSPTEIAMHIPYMFSPKERGENDDRMLGIGIRKIRFRSVIEQR